MMSTEWLFHFSKMSLMIDATGDKTKFKCGLHESEEWNCRSAHTHHSIASDFIEFFFLFCFVSASPDHLLLLFNLKRDRTFQLCFIIIFLALMRACVYVFVCFCFVCSRFSVVRVCNETAKHSDELLTHTHTHTIEKLRRPTMMAVAATFRMWLGCTLSAHCTPRNRGSHKKKVWNARKAEWWLIHVHWMVFASHRIVWFHDCIKLIMQ